MLLLASKACAVAQETLAIWCSLASWLRVCAVKALWTLNPLFCCFYMWVFSLASPIGCKPAHIVKKVDGVSGIACRSSLKWSIFLKKSTWAERILVCALLQPQTFHRLRLSWQPSGAHTRTGGTCGESPSGPSDMLFGMGSSWSKSWSENMAQKMMKGKANTHCKVNIMLFSILQMCIVCGSEHFFLSATFSYHISHVNYRDVFHTWCSEIIWCSTRPAYFHLLFLLT